MEPTALEWTLLCDYYGELLTEKQKTCFDLYYNQDFSLAEIAENEGISRQGVHDSIVRAEALLRSCEEKLGCVARAAQLQASLAGHPRAARTLAASGEHDHPVLAGEILRAADSIKE